MKNWGGVEKLNQEFEGINRQLLFYDTYESSSTTNLEAGEYINKLLAFKITINSNVKFYPLQIYGRIYPLNRPLFGNITSIIRFNENMDIEAIFTFPSVPISQQYTLSIFVNGFSQKTS